MSRTVSERCTDDCLTTCFVPCECYCHQVRPIRDEARTRLTPKERQFIDGPGPRGTRSVREICAAANPSYIGKRLLTIINRLTEREKET